jgi:hypothetical protein
MKVNCTTMTFMLGVIIGALIHTENSFINVITSIVLATVVFHFTSVTEYGSKVIKKGF